MSGALLVFAIISVTSLLYFCLKLLKLSRIINRIPGPAYTPIVGNALQFKKHPFDVFQIYSKNAKLYHDAKLYRFWLGPVPNVVFFKAETAEVVFGSSVQISKSFGYTFLEPWLGTGLLTSNGSKWYSRRKLLTPTFHFQILQDFFNIFCEQSEILIDLLKTKADGQKINFYSYISLCTLDIICETAMGKKVNAQREKDSEYIQAVQRVKTIIYNRLHKPWLWPNFLFDLIGDGNDQKACLKVLHDFTNKVIQERSIEIKEMKFHETNANITKRKKLAFLDLLLQTSENENVLSFKDIQEEVDTFMFEGHDSTAAAAFWALQVIGSYPEIQSKLYQEMKQIFGESNRSPTLDDIKEMKYLECVLKEVFRLYPPVPRVSRRATEKFEVFGYEIPKNTYLVMDIYNLHRDPDYFPEPEKFEPDRFLPENSSGRHPFAFVPFSAGPRNCIGQRFAMLEEKTLLSYLLRNFHVESEEDLSEFCTFGQIILQSKNELHLKIHKRNLKE